MKLVIDIPDETANAIKDNVMFGVIPSEILWDVTSAIVNGIPLDKIRTEIEQTAKDYDKFADYRRVYGLWIAIDIIDKYRVKSEESE